jgi:hypothetical protein
VKSKQVPIRAKDIIKVTVEQKAKKVERKLTSQHFTGRFNDTKNKRIAFFVMQNLCRQAGHFIIKNRYLLRQGRNFASFIKRHLSFAFG